MNIVGDLSTAGWRFNPQYVVAIQQRARRNLQIDDLVILIASKLAQRRGVESYAPKLLHVLLPQAKSQWNRVSLSLKMEFQLRRGRNLRKRGPLARRLVTKMHEIWLNNLSFNCLSLPSGNLCCPERQRLNGAKKRLMESGVALNRHRRHSLGGTLRSKKATQ